MQNYVIISQIDFYGYRSIENSRFNSENVSLSFKNAHVKSYGGLKFWIIFGGLDSLISKYFIEGAMEPLKCIYILARHQIPFRLVYKRTSSGITKKFNSNILYN